MKIYCVILRVLGWIGIPGMLAAVSLCVYWQAWPYDLGRDRRVTVITPFIEPGESLELAVFSCQGFQLTESITRVLPDDSIYSMAFRSHVDDEAGCHSLVVSIPLPSEAMLGEHRLLVTAEYQANPIRSIIHRYPPETFSVLRRAKS